MFDKPLTRTNPTGQQDAGWMCQPCIKIMEPELYKNLKDDGNLKITNDIFNAVDGGVLCNSDRRRRRKIK